MLIDLHARSDASIPGAASARRVLEVAKERRLGGVAFVESLVSSHARAIRAASEAVGIPAFVGVEIPTTIGRFLCFAPQVEPFIHREEWRQCMAGGLAPTYEALFRLFDGVGGAVIASQPYLRDGGTRLGDRVTICEGLHGLELTNAQASPADAKMAAEISVKAGIPSVAGSCASRGLRDIGCYATLFADAVTTQEDLCAALRGGNFWAVTLGEAVRTSADRPRREEGEGERSGDRGERGGRRGGRGDRGERGDRGDRGDRRGASGGRGRDRGKGRAEGGRPDEPRAEGGPSEGGRSRGGRPRGRGGKNDRRSGSNEKG